jgi:7-cyano-7-deazaguanine synthase in queuosine biosynthesis
MKKITSPYKTFRFVSYDFDADSGVASFVYGLDDKVTFTERVKFGGEKGGEKGVSPQGEDRRSRIEHCEFDKALFALHLMAGISYYKAYCPPEMVIEYGELAADEAVFWDKLYTHGLGEFFYKNDLDFRDYIHFPVSEGRKDQQNEKIHDSRPDPLPGAIVPIGGGKDSLVTVEMLQKAGIDFDLVALGRHERIAEVAEAIGEPLNIIERTLDPQLFELNKQGALNGHVPISAYIAFTMVVYALLNGKRDIVLSNERSANAGNVMMGDLEINHQYSKSWEFERDIQAYIAASITPKVRYFSLLRPLSELAIVKKFVDEGKYFEVFSSCNKNYAINKKAAKRWCGECPKCAFVFAMMAAFMPKEKVVEIFGKNLLADDGLLPVYKELLAVEGIKPFECVGEPEEVLAAFVMAHKRGDFADDIVMKWFASELIGSCRIAPSRILVKLGILQGTRLLSPDVKDFDVIVSEVLTSSDEHAMPEEYAKLVYEN